MSFLSPNRKLGVLPSTKPEDSGMFWNVCVCVFHPITTKTKAKEKKNYFIKNIKKKNLFIDFFVCVTSERNQLLVHCDMRPRVVEGWQPLDPHVPDQFVRGASLRSGVAVIELHQLRVNVKDFE